MPFARNHLASLEHVAQAGLTRVARVARGARGGLAVLVTHGIRHVTTDTCFPSTD